MSKERLDALDAINDCKRELKGLSNILYALAESPTETEPEELQHIAEALGDNARKLAEATAAL